MFISGGENEQDPCKCQDMQRSKKHTNVYKYDKTQKTDPLLPPSVIAIQHQTVQAGDDPGNLIMEH